MLRKITLTKTKYKELFLSVFTLIDLRCRVVPCSSQPRGPRRTRQCLEGALVWVGGVMKLQGWSDTFAHFCVGLS
jgi:hypothetical protein